MAAFGGECRDDFPLMARHGDARLPGCIDPFCVRIVARNAREIVVSIETEYRNC